LGGELKRKVIYASFLAAALYLSGGAHAQAPANTRATKPAAATPAQVQVDLLRGLADIFSRGLDTLGERLNRQGYTARVYSTNGWQTVSRRIAENYTRGHKDIIVIIGHSLGGNAALKVANALDKQNIPIELIVTFDATQPEPVTKNVLHVVNFYQENGFGKPVSAGPGFNGELTNVDLTADPNLSHVTIEKSPRLHAVVERKIEDAIKKDLAKRVQATRKNNKAKKS
jgi:hypothetical protein